MGGMVLGEVGHMVLGEVGGLYGIRGGGWVI